MASFDLPAFEDGPGAEGGSAGMTPAVAAPNGHANHSAMSMQRSPPLNARVSAPSSHPRSSSSVDAVLEHTTLLHLSLEALNPALTPPSAVSAQLHRLAQHLPTNRWRSLPTEDTFDPNVYQVDAFSMQHGKALPPLMVKVLHNHVLLGVSNGNGNGNGSGSGQSANAAARAQELDQALQWLMETLNIGSAYPVLGVDCESDCKLTSAGEVRLLQLSTGTRCLLIRLPPQRDVQRFCQQTGYTQQIAHIMKQQGNNHAMMPPSPLFTPFFHQIMKNRQIMKAGAELWTDALDLWSCCPGVELNSCLNMSWIYRNEHGGALSLAAMVNLSLGVEGSFLKDKETTTSSWGADHLSIRQLIYAALDAQTSWVAGANQRQIPSPFNVSDMPRAWLQRAAQWKAILRAYKLERDAALKRLRIRAAAAAAAAKSNHATSAVRIPDSSTTPAENMLIDAAWRYFAAYFQGEDPFNPFCAILMGLAFPSFQQALQSMPPPNTPQPSSQRSTPSVDDSSSTSSTSSASSSSSSLSQTFFQTLDLSIETTNVHHWFTEKMQPNTDATFHSQPYWTRLDAEQKRAIEEAEVNRVAVVTGAPGVGRSVTAAALVARSLTRSSTIDLHHSPPDMQSSRQRILCLCESDTAARQLAECIAHILPPSRLILFVSAHVLQSWQPEQFPILRGEGYVYGLENNTAAATATSNDSTAPPTSASSDTDRDVLVTTFDYALNGSSSMARRLLHRQTVLVDDSNQVMLLKAILLLRKLAHTERLILFGDRQGMTARLGHFQLESILDAALTSASTQVSSVSCTSSITMSILPPPFRNLAHVELTTQYRLPPHLYRLLSSLFYGPHTHALQQLQSSSNNNHRKRAIGWVDVKGGAVQHSSSSSEDESLSLSLDPPAPAWTNANEITHLTHLWNFFASKPNFTLDDIAILVFFESQREEIARLQPTMRARTFIVEAFQGNTAQIVLVSMAAPRILDCMEEMQRLQVLLSRSSCKLFLVGDRSSLLSSVSEESIWHRIDEYVQTDLEDIFPELKLAQEAFPALTPTLAPAPAPTPTATHANTNTNTNTTAATATTTQLSAAQSAASTPSIASTAASPVPTSTATPAPTPAPISSGPSILDLQLLRSIASSLRSPYAEAGVTLQGLANLFELVHGKAWNTYSWSPIQHFVRHFIPQYFTLKTNRDNKDDPYVNMDEQQYERLRQPQSAQAQQQQLPSVTQPPASPSFLAAVAPVTSAAAAAAASVAPTSSAPKTVVASNRLLIPSSSTSKPASTSTLASKPIHHSFVHIPHVNYKSHLCAQVHPNKDWHSASAVSSKPHHKQHQQCTLGDKCGHLHHEFWMRAPDPSPVPLKGAGAFKAKLEFWCVAPGSDIIHWDRILMEHTHRIEQMQKLIDSTYNRTQLKKYWQEVAHYWPPSTSATAAALGRATATSSPLLSSSSASPPIPSASPALSSVSSSPAQPSRHQQRSTLAQPPAFSLSDESATASTPASAAFTVALSEQTSVKASTTEPSPADTTATSALTPEELALKQKERAAAKKLRIAREKEEKRLAAEAAEAEAAAKKAAAEAEFHEVSGRRASKHPHHLAAALAAEQQRKESSKQAANVGYIECPFCHSHQPLDSDTCSQCFNDLRDEPQQEEQEEEEEEEEVEVKAEEKSDTTTETKLSKRQQKKLAAAAAAAAAAVAPTEKASKEGSKGQTKAESKVKPSPSTPTKSDKSVPNGISAADSSPSSNSSSSASSAAVTDDSLTPAYASMDRSRYFSLEELSLLSKRQKKLLQWLCSSCGCPNESKVQGCSICGRSKPASSIIRYQRVESEREKLAKPWFTTEGKEIRYESSAVALAKNDQYGWHLVTKRFVQAGEVLLEDHMMTSVGVSATKSVTSLPPPTQVAHIANLFVSDPLQMASHKDPRGQLLPDHTTPIKKPAKNIDSNDWMKALHYAYKAQFKREPNPPHAACTCCPYGRWRLPRQAALLVPSCWPNCAATHPIGCESALDRQILAITDMEADTILTGLPFAMSKSTIFMPREIRMVWAKKTVASLNGGAGGAGAGSEELKAAICKCARCTGALFQGQRIGVDADRLIEQILPGPPFDLRAMKNAYEDLMDHFSVLPELKRRVRTANEIEKEESKNNKKKKKNCCPPITMTEYEQEVIDLCCDAISFLRRWPLHMCHWCSFQVRHRVLNVLLEHRAWRSDFFLFTSPLTYDPEDPDYDAEEVEQEEEEQEAHALFLRKVLFVIAEQIHANATYLQPMDPNKSQALFALDEFKRDLDEEDLILEKDINDPMTDDEEEEEDDEDEPTKDEAEKEKNRISASSSASTSASDPKCTCPKPTNSNSKQAASSSSAASKDSKNAQQQQQQQTKKKAAAKKSKPYRKDLVSFPQIGTKEGQDKFFEFLTTVIEPNAKKLKDLGYPRAD